MSAPIATLGSSTILGDLIISSDVKHLYMCMPIATITDQSAGAACVGVISMSPNIRKIYAPTMTPAGTVGASIMGANPATGIPVSSAIGASVTVKHMC
ncbi:MAG: hypothetical protein GY750_06360 [Lentisphaerae bacterium]|nr:hypothetical protein [Lentisphaerota bacterium]MCP4101031.1 hypothetical protein [Lentisphaerota bacterium]